METLRFIGSKENAQDILKALLDAGGHNNLKMKCDDPNKEYYLLPNKTICSKPIGTTKEVETPKPQQRPAVQNKEVETPKQQQRQAVQNKVSHLKNFEDLKIGDTIYTAETCFWSDLHKHKNVLRVKEWKIIKNGNISSYSTIWNTKEDPDGCDYTARELTGIQWNSCHIICVPKGISCCWHPHYFAATTREELEEIVKEYAEGFDDIVY